MPSNPSTSSGQAADNRRQILVQAGLSPDQASIYELLVKNGPMHASEAARKALISRPLGYKVLGELEAAGLVEKRDEPGKVALFVAQHPLKLKEFSAKRLEAARDAKDALESMLATLISDFNTVAGQPGVRIMEGVGGVAELYEDILNEQQDILLIRSPNDDKFPELAKLVEKQIRDQVAAGIKTRAITPLEPDTPAVVLSKDNERLVTRRVVTRNRFEVPAQIIVYADKVAITAYGEQLMTTIIENPLIKKTFEIVFEYIWAAATPEHEKFIAELANGRPSQDTV